MTIGRGLRARGMISQVASASVLAVLLIQSVYFHFLVVTGEPRAWHAVAAIAAVAVLAALLAPAIAWLRKRMAAHGTRGKVWLAAAFIVAGWLLTWAIPVPPAPQALVELQVDATGFKSDDAQSSEVWVRLQRDGVSIPPGQLEHDGKWHVDGEFLVSVPGRQPARLNWLGKAGGQLTLVMVSHPWSGQAEVTVGGRRQAFDLYSPGSDGQVVTISGEPLTDDRLVYPDRTPMQHWVQVGDGVLIGAALLALFLLLGTRPLSTAVQASRISQWQEVALHALPTVLVGTALLALYFPGLMTSDSLDQWRQASSGQYNDAHPLLYAFVIRALRVVWDSPAIVAAVQCLAMALAVGWLIALVRRGLGARFATAHVGAWLVALHPLVALTNITLWKDVFYTVSIVVLTGFLAKALFSRDARPLSRGSLVGLVIAAVACMSLRHNGPPVALAAFALLIAVKREGRKTILAAAFTSLALFLLLKGPVADAVRTERTDLSYALFSHHIGAHLAHGHVPPGEQDRVFLSSLDRDDATWRYNCAVVNPTIFNASFQTNQARQASARLRSIWIELATARPAIEANHMLCASSLIWRISGDHPLYLAGIALWAPDGVVRWIVSGPGEPVEASVAPPTADAFGKWLLGWETDAFWRPAAYLYLLLLSVCVAAFRYRDARWLLVAVPSAVHSLVLVAASLAQDARYQLPVYVVALALVPLLLVGRAPVRSRRELTAAPAPDHGIPSVMAFDERPLGTDCIAVVIPCFRVTAHIEAVIAAIGPEVARIYCVDDACPDGSGDYIGRHVQDARVRVLRHSRNQGVGGAVMTGYGQAVADGAAVIVKIDGDGQMDPALLPDFVSPILAGEADYTKGNRFWDLKQIHRMPFMRRIGNLGLSFFAKASTGYWDLFDPTNGYTAIHASVAARLPLESISRRYFFETDMLFRLNSMRAVVVDIPMDANYGDEVSSLSIHKVFGEFLMKHLANTGKRIGYSYFLRDLSIGSLELMAAVGLLGFGLVFGGWHWWLSAGSGASAALGTVMIATVAVVSGLQFLLAFLNYDITAVPRRPLSRVLSRTSARSPGATPETAGGAP